MRYKLWIIIKCYRRKNNKRKASFYLIGLMYQQTAGYLLKSHLV